jgi:NADPH:quinone reductase-like Zn-dependent oxidoreductase
VKAFALVSAGRPAAIVDIPKPDIGPSEALIRVKAASVNGIDIYQATGALAGMMEHVYPTVIGRDFAGTIEAVGPGFDGFAAGDEVFGFLPPRPPLQRGTFSEYMAAGPAVILAGKPAGVGFNEAAALPLAGAAALDLLDAIAATAGDVVLIVGATGGVGSLAIQIATQRGLKVIATARADEVEFVQGLGAAETVDYTAGSVADAVRGRFPDGIAAVIDVVNQKEALTALSSVVRSGGRVATLMNAADVEALAALNIVGTSVAAAPTTAKLQLLADMAASGSLRVPIDVLFPIDRADQALQAFQHGTRGKVVVTV